MFLQVVQTPKRVNRVVIVRLLYRHHIILDAYMYIFICDWDPFRSLKRDWSILSGSFPGPFWVHFNDQNR